MNHHDDEMRCAICIQPLTSADRQTAMVWIDPGGQPCVAHRPCLVRLGEFDLDLPPVA